MLYRPSQAFTITAVILFITISSSLWYRDDAIAIIPHVSFGGATCPNTKPMIYPTTFVHSNIAVASNFGYHFDVYIPLVWSIQRVLKGAGHVQVYASTPFGFNFQNVSEELGLYHGHVKEPKDLIHDIRQSPEGGGIDLVILGTCEIDINVWHNDLLAAWDARDDDNKFKVVCIVHHAGDVGWQTNIGSWASRNAIRLLPIAEHVGNAFRQIFEALSISADSVAMRTAGFEHIPIDVHVPILDLPRLPQLPEPRVLSNAVIQGSFSFSRRAYSEIFQELIQCLHEDPEAWGYLPLDDEPSYIPNAHSIDPPFKLHLVGSGLMDIPLELKNIVIFHVQLDYDQYYDIMAGMDICVPAFGPSSDYFTVQASSTVAMCMETNVPILLTRRMRNAYKYIDDDRVVVSYPAVMTEMDAIKALRTRNASQFLASDPANSGRTMGSNSAVRSAVEQMIREEWIRPKNGFQSFKRGVWAANDLVVRRLLSDQ